MSVIAERTEEEQLLESWLEGDVPCHMKECAAAATWRMVLSCSHTATYCSPHKVKMSEHHAAGILCECGRVTPITMVGWVSF